MKLLSLILSKLRRRRESAWQVIFYESKLYGGEYRGESLPTQAWEWPKTSWLKSRMELLREQGRMK